MAIFWIIHISLYKKEKNPEWEWDSLFYLFLFSLLLVRVFGFWSSEYLFIFIRRKILFDFTVVKFGLCTNPNSVAYRVKWLGWFFHARIRVWQRPLFWVSSPLLLWLLHPHFTVYYTSVLLCLVAEELLKGYGNWQFFMLECSSFSYLLQKFVYVHLGYMELKYCCWIFTDFLEIFLSLKCNLKFSWALTISVQTHRHLTTHVSGDCKMINSFGNLASTYSFCCLQRQATGRVSFFQTSAKHSYQKKCLLSSEVSAWSHWPCIDLILKIYVKRFWFVYV